ncbi:FAD/NAD-P-binding domain-containing protein [Epithele typhae]|uniref:FAD/NAD-P-binding domain-containing protein n=1 Tax=Epithele typhae TaxID=378194 RepID=UPI0020084F96|nr:FAD/NAD-P-binding domain-containing protein [Epithele typhae]KAH9942535.1 FAD/NAD-P-binding domain-containing protein [Epithele typhae]
MSKIIRRWVDEEELLRISTRCVGTPFHHLKDGEFVGYVHWKPAVMAETGGDFLVTYRGDLIRLLYKTAKEAGAQITFGAEVVVTLANGDVLTCDILIGADGVRSRVREVVLEDDDDCLEPAGMTLYTGIVDAEDMLKDDDLRPFVLSDEWPIWMGEHRSLAGHPMVMRENKFYFHFYSHQHDTIPKAPRPIHPAVDQLAPELVRTTSMRHDDIDDWIDATGASPSSATRHTHQWCPGGSHACSMAVEDATVLGSLFSRITLLDEIPTLLSAYHELRERRAAFGAAADWSNARMLVWPEGPAAAARDEDMRRRKDEWDEGTVKKEFEEIAELFLYDAYDAAEEWWLNWGRFSESARARPALSFDFFAVSTVQCES